MTNQEIVRRLIECVANERRITNELLGLMNLAAENKSFREIGYTSVFDWLTRGLGFANASASRRINAARMLRKLPMIEERLRDGRINLSHVDLLHRKAKAQTKFSEEEVPVATLEKLVESIERQTVEEAERIIVAELPLSAREREPDKRVVVDEEYTRHSMTLSRQTTSDIDRAKEVLSHKLPCATEADIVGYALQFMLDKLDPLRQKSSAADAKKKPSEASVRRATFKRDNGACTYQDPDSGNVCGSRYQTQGDHIIPLALGGTNEPSNRRCLCGVHNRMVAEQMLGYYRRKVKQTSKKNATKKPKGNRPLDH